MCACVCVCVCVHVRVCVCACVCVCVCVCVYVCVFVIILFVWPKYPTPVFLCSTCCPHSVIDRIVKTADLVCCVCAFIYSHACVDAVCVHYYVCGCKMGVR